jgi:hypothetical protein
MLNIFYFYPKRKTQQLFIAGFFFYLAVLNLSVDFRSRRFAFRGRSGEPPAGVFAPSDPINRVPKSTIALT